MLLIIVCVCGRARVCVCVQLCVFVECGWDVWCVHEDVAGL